MTLSHKIPDRVIRIFMRPQGNDWSKKKCLKMSKELKGLKRIVL